MSQLALFDSLEYLWYGSTIIINMFTLTVWEWTLDVMTSKVEPRTTRVERFYISMVIHVVMIIPLGVKISAW